MKRDTVTVEVSVEGFEEAEIKLKRLRALMRECNELAHEISRANLTLVLETIKRP